MRISLHTGHLRARLTTIQRSQRRWECAREPQPGMQLLKIPRVDSIVENTLFANGKNHRYHVDYQPNRFDFDVALSKPATVDFPVVKYAGTDGG